MESQKELTPFQKALTDSILDDFPDLPEDDDDIVSEHVLNKLLEKFSKKPKE